MQKMYPLAAGKNEEKSVGLLKNLHAKTFSSFEVNFMDGSEYQKATERDNNETDESIIEFDIADRAILNGIGNINKLHFLQYELHSKTVLTLKSLNYCAVGRFSWQFLDWLQDHFHYSTLNISRLTLI